MGLISSIMGKQIEQDALNLSPADFAYYPNLERKLYKDLGRNFDSFKYIHAHSKKNGVRMLFIQDIIGGQKESKIIYCVNKNRKAVIPVTIEKDDGEDVLKEDYFIEYMYDKDILFFMENLGRDDIVRTHKHAILPGEMSDVKIIKILEEYLSN